MKTQKLYNEEAYEPENKHNDEDRCYSHSDSSNIWYN